ncbi:MAG: J domain-containing protein [Desulfuromonadaceae bacterium]|nr:J domain-containing protein [Desulfuromonadaceae bacterium]
MSAILSEIEVFKACRTLFGAEVDLSLDFLSYLQPSGVKIAYRQRVKETHPDTFVGDAAQTRHQTGLFQEVAAAYELFGNFFKQRERGLGLAGRTRSSPRTSQPQPQPPGGFRSSRPTKEKTQARRSPGWGPTPRQPHLYCGHLPGRTLEFGMFLYYQRLIDYRLLVEALVWQRGQRPNLGDIAQRWGWLNNQEIRTVLASRGHLRRFGEKAVHLQYLSERQLQTLLYYQRSQQKRLGEFFVEKKILTAADIDRLVLEQQAHNRQVAAELLRASR